MDSEDAELWIDKNVNAQSSNLMTEQNHYLYEDGWLNRKTCVLPQPKWPALFFLGTNSALAYSNDEMQMQQYFEKAYLIIKIIKAVNLQNISSEFSPKPYPVKQKHRKYAVPLNENLPPRCRIKLILGTKVLWSKVIL